MTHLQNARKLVAAALLLKFAAGCTNDAPAPVPDDSVENLQAAVTVTSEDSKQLEHDIQKFCGACHETPRADSFPREAWYDEVKRGFNFYYDSGRRDLTPPPQSEVVAWYRAQAPEKLPMPDQPEVDSKTIQFRPTEIVAPQFISDGPLAVSFINLLTIDGNDGNWVSDMRSGVTGLLPASDLLSNHQAKSIKSQLNLNFTGLTANPAAVREVDIDGNGVNDLVLSDLGSFLPQDHDRGKVVWIPDGTSSTKREPVTIIEKIGRVADILPMDVDSDGDPDLIVGSFGWHKTGGVYVVYNDKSSSGTEVTFRSVKVDERPGSIHILPAELNNDGRPDFIALISQEHEEITAYLNLESGFEKKPLYEAPDPSWGSSGMQQVDLDADGDLDIIYTNGDTFDSYVVKPYHGVWFLENTGTLPLTAHHIAAMPGVHRALAHDLDGDGDLDVAAAALLPTASARGVDVSNMHSVVWLEQVKPGQFDRHVISKGRPTHAAMAIGDLNHDGRPELIVGSFHEEPSDSAPVATVFWNEPNSP